MASLRIPMAMFLIFSSACPPTRADAVAVILDTDIGNDIDDALALAVLHALESRGECRLLAVTVTKDNPNAAAVVDAINTFYGRPDIPIGVVRAGKTPDDGKYLRAIADANTNQGQPLYPHDLMTGRDAPDAVPLLRKTLAAQADQSVVVVQVGFSSNLAALLDSEPDPICALPGKELVAAKCRLLSIMAGNFAPDGHDKEYNVYMDAPAAKKLFGEWPTPIVASGFEVGRGIRFPAASIQADFDYSPHHPIADAYRLYDTMPYDRETWDLTSVLFAVRPDYQYFGLSDAGTIRVDDADVTQFTFHKDGRHRYLTITPEQGSRIRETLAHLASQPPNTRCTNGK